MKVVDMGVDIECCGDTMHPLKANTEEASVEKHLPVVTRIDESRIRVDVGSEPHPMSSEHHIGKKIIFALLITDKYQFQGK